MTLKPESYRPETAGRGRPKFIWLLIFLSLVVVVLTARQWLEGRRLSALQATPASMEPRPAPDFNLKTVGGSQMRLSDLRGQVVLLNFWATWCLPCVAEMPALEALNRDYGPEHNFMVVGVDAQESEEAITAFAHARGVSFPLLIDSEGTVSFDSYDVRSLPTTMIIDREGNIRDSWLGQIPRPAMVARLERVW